MVEISGTIKYVDRSQKAKIISNDGEFFLLNGTDASGYYTEANYKSAVAVLKFRGYSGGDHIHLKGRKIEDDHIEIEEIL
jgi:hypothetical protein